ncbi:MAG: glycosyltransferase family 2 protein [Chitinophagales bacterium]|nr:glycosyltransferase family 2 protein [Chitinophagales bacterium]
MLLSIIICSRNRAKELEQCLPLVAEQAALFPDTEVLVIDNGSADNTAEVVKTVSEKSDYTIRYVLEPVPGLCQARNRGRQEARGEVLTYIDDDVRLDENWILKIRQHYLQHPETFCLGGRVTVKLDEHIPFPIGENMRWFFGATRFGNEYRELNYPEHPIGCNMSFRAIVFDQVGGFNTNLKLYGDETEFFSRVTKQGYKLIYDPEITVYQFIPASRLTKEELRHKSYIWGRGSATGWMIANQSPLKRLARITQYLLRTGYMFVRLPFKTDFGSFYTYWYYRGYLSKLVAGLDKNKTDNK